MPKTTDNQQQPDNRSYDVGLQTVSSFSSFCSKNVVAYLKNCIETQKNKGREVRLLRF